MNDKDLDEHYTLLDFNEARSFVPNDIYRDVHQDNKKFLSEKQIYSEPFF